MELGTYVDGRKLNYDESSSQFSVGEAPVTNEQVVGYDRVGQLNWLSDETRAKAYELAGTKMKPKPPEDPKGFFGFRSKQPWKMVVASSYYFVAVLGGMGVMTSRKPYSTAGQDIAIEVLSGLFMTLALLAPALFLSDFGYRDKLPLFKKRSIGWSALGLSLFFVLMVATSAFADSFHTEPYKVAAAKESAEQQASEEERAAAEAKRQAEAKAKAAAEAESKKSAEASAAAEAKRIADEKAAAEASAAAVVAARAPKPKPAPVEAPKPPSKEDYLRKVVTDELGATTNMDDKPKVIEIADSGGDAYWLIRLNGNENFTNNMTKEGMWLEGMDVWERVFTERKDIDELAIFWYFPLVDAKGNTSDEVVMKLWMSKANAADVNWDNVLLKNVPVIADDYWESPVFNN